MRTHALVFAALVGIACLAPIRALAECPVGQSITTDTDGQCCWDGQVWFEGKCVGLPTSCPPNYGVDVATQSCLQTPCQYGMVRTEASGQCCWPGQAYSTIRSTCVGLPTCPAGFEASGESCRSSDLDGDGVPNAVDKCPDAPEDIDGFQDDDGCADSDNDADGFADVSDACRDHPEDKNGYRDDDGCPDQPEYDQVLADQERQRREAEEQRLRAEQAQIQAQNEEAERQRRIAVVDDYETQRSSAARRRVTGWVLGGLGSAGLVGGAVFGLKAQRINEDIAAGGFENGDDIQSASDAAQLNSVLSVSLFAAGGIAAGVGVIIVLVNLPPEEPQFTFISTARTPVGFALRW